MSVLEPGDIVAYVDEYGKSHNAILTNVWGGPNDETPAVNLVWVTDDSTKHDQYGNQIERNISVVHKYNQSAHGRYWEFLS